MGYSPSSLRSNDVWLWGMWQKALCFRRFTKKCLKVEILQTEMCPRVNTGINRVCLMSILRRWILNSILWISIRGESCEIDDLIQSYEISQVHDMRHYYNGVMISRWDASPRRWWHRSIDHKMRLKTNDGWPQISDVQSWDCMFAAWSRGRSRKSLERSPRSSLGCLGNGANEPNSASLTWAWVRANECVAAFRKLMDFRRTGVICLHFIRSFQDVRTDI